ncbi:MAG: Asp-tRNA(Asn)/Glu-tRNA(Gln) amidotransferase subunit GatB [Candidatus Saccharimonadales bacterium]
MSDYLPTIGIECHVQLKTNTKLFAAVANDAREAPPNTLISHICLGMPGALPVLNGAAVDLAITAAFALGTEPQLFSTFDRKHYFYPDLPKGYQISQLYQPIILGGYVDIEVDGQPKRIGVTRAHMEEDAGKSTHPTGKNYSLIDLNRAGTPLLEIVSEPDIKSAVEAKAYAHELYLLMRYAKVSDANLYYGNMRFDVNVSVSKDPNVLGTRSETKNLNSFRSVEKSVEYEIKRQIEVLESGGEIVQETRGWDDAKQKTFSQRTKEDAHDYRYFPDPDIPPIVLEQSRIEAARQAMPVMPSEVRAKLRELKIDESATETIIDELVAAKTMLSLMDAGAPQEDIRRIALWLAGDIQGFIAADELLWENLRLDTSALCKLSQLTGQAKVSSTAAKSILMKLIQGGGDPESIAKELDVLQVSDSAELETIVEQTLADNQKAAEDVRNGEMKAIGFLVGQVMKASKGKANPGVVQTLIKKRLSA